MVSLCVKSNYPTTLTFSRSRPQESFSLCKCAEAVGLFVHGVCVPFSFCSFFACLEIKSVIHHHHLLY